MSAKGTSHHKMHGLAGLVMILTLPLFLWGLCGAISGQAAGFAHWVSSPFGAISLIIFSDVCFGLHENGNGRSDFRLFGRRHEKPRNVGKPSRRFCSMGYRGLCDR